MSVVSVEELQGYMSGIRMKDGEKRSAQVIIEGVQAELERYINRPIEQRVVREVALTTSTGDVYLTQSPVRGITKITYVEAWTSFLSPGRGVILDDLTNIPDVPGYDTVPANFGRDLIVPGGLLLPEGAGQFVIVEYLAGGGDFIAPYLPAIRLAILRVASREFQQMNDDTMSLRNANATEPVDPIPVPRRGWLLDEFKEFDRIRRRVVM